MREDPPICPMFLSALLTQMKHFAAAFEAGGEEAKAARILTRCKGSACALWDHAPRHDESREGRAMGRCSLSHGRNFEDPAERSGVDPA